MEQPNEKAVVFLPWSTIEPEARQQILNTARMPFVFKHVAVMPDCHYGRGATVGTVLPTNGAIIPAAVGVDIGCGMIAVKTPLTRSDIRNPRAIRAGIERRIPMSAGKNNPTVAGTAIARVKALEALAARERVDPDQYDKKWRLALGTLGGGNHFIELAEDAAGTVWATLHSGSRGVGNRIGAHFIKVSQELCKKQGIDLPDRDLAYLSEDHPAFNAYMRALHWAQQFAFHNRNEMMDRVLTELSVAVYESEERRADLEVQRINCHHNFTQKEVHFGRSVWVTRKGAIQAETDMWAMIPGSMGTRSYIVVGKAHPMSFHSAPHGAGRRYSRTKARALFNMGRPDYGDERYRVPARQGAARRNPGGVQGHRSGHGTRQGSGRREIRPQAVRERQRGLTGHHPRRLLRLALPALEGSLLPGVSSGVTLAGLLHDPVRHRGTEQHVLPPAARVCLRHLARASQARLRLFA
jgi:tRNA-splicing ligase RtcB